MDTLKKAGAMLAHLELFHSMQDLRRLLQLAAHMKERGDRAMLISAEEISLIGAEPLTAPEIVTSKGETIDAATAYRVLARLEGYEAPEYAVNREALTALNARAVAELESSDALRAFEATLARIQAAPSTPAPTATPSEAAPAATEPNATERGAEQAAERPSERSSRSRRQPEAEASTETAAAN